MLTHPENNLTMAESAVQGIAGFDRLFVVLRADHAAQLGKNWRHEFFRGASVIVLRRKTATQIDTVRRALRASKWSGGFAVKDCDNRFTATVVRGNFAAVVGIGEVSCLRDASAKSYAIVRGNEIIELREKSPISSTFCCGLYGFESAAVFHRASSGCAFLSEALQNIIQTGGRVGAVRAQGYEDYGTAEAWESFCDAYGNYFVDVDGVLLTHAGRLGRARWFKNQRVILENVEWLASKPGRVILCTARPERLRKQTVAQLKRAGIRFDSLVMGLCHARRYQISDHAPSIPEPACVSISIPRNGSIRQTISRPPELLACKSRTAGL